MFLEIILLPAKHFLPHIRWVAYHNIKSTLFKHIRECVCPAEWSDLLLLSKFKLAVIEISVNETVATLNVVIKCWKYPLVKKSELLVNSGFGLTFHTFQ
ncbi:MAG: hypothetical protein BWX96_03201 [Bacteroidetes bacterium ADurb.Bin145]|nr:MAG: hypothetical protein BWX96_03201 [Bacteroidetes bacterium ADurb.Bin145]